MVAGVLLAAAGLVTSSGRKVARADVVAIVDGHAIAMTDYRRMLDAVADDSDEEPDEATRRFVLDRMIEEELLLARAEELGIVRADRRLRSELVAAMVDTVTHEAAQSIPAEAELEAFYRAERDRFVGADRFRLARAVVRVGVRDDEAARLRAGELRRRVLGGESLATVAAELADPEPAPLPDALLPPNKLLDYLGPTALRAVTDVAEGGLSEAVRTSAGYEVYLVVERRAGPAPELADIRPQVLAAWQRRQADAALRRYVDALHARARIVIP